MIAKHIILTSICLVFVYFHGIKPMYITIKETVTEARQRLKNVLIDAICSKYALVPYYTLDEINAAREYMNVQTFGQLWNLYKALK